MCGVRIGGNFGIAVGKGALATALRVFFRYCIQRRWTREHFADSIRGPRIYALENLPAGPDWSDVRQLFAALDRKDSTDLRDRPILMLMAIYGLRAGEVARLFVVMRDQPWAPP